MTYTERQSRIIILLLGFLAAIGPLSVDTYLPGLPAIATEFGVPGDLAQRSLSSFFLGIAAGQVVAGPLSDCFGRRIVLLAGFALYFFATVLCAITKSIDMLIIARGLQGLSAAVSPAAGRAMVRDIWSGNQAARAMSYVMMAMTIAPLIAPSLGGVIMLYASWRAIFWMLLIFSATCLCLVLWVLPETNGPEKRSDIRLLDYFRAYRTVLSNSSSWSYLLCGGLSYATMFAYITGSPFVYIELFHVSPAHYGMYFALNVLGLFIFTWLNSRLVVRYGYHCLLFFGVIVALAGCALLLLTSYFAVGALLAVVIGLFIAVSPTSLVGSNSTVGLLNLFPHNAGAAAGLFGVAQFGFGAIASLLVGLFYSGTPLAMAGVMLLTALGSAAAVLCLKVDSANDK
jgi:DHA1 family bicyclomycin/chloramphenicol resistance-like MFS transporter